MRASKAQYLEQHPRAKAREREKKRLEMARYRETLQAKKVSTAPEHEKLVTSCIKREKLKKETAKCKNIDLEKQLNEEKTYEGNTAGTKLEDEN